MLAQTDLQTPEEFDAIVIRDVASYPVRIRDVIAGHLSDKERVIVTLYYYEGLSMKEIAKVLNLTESRICQIHGKVVERLKEQLQRTRANLFI